MKITITLNLPVEQNSQCLPATLHKLARLLETEYEPEVHPMDGSIQVTDYEGNRVGLCEFDEDDEEDG